MGSDGCPPAKRRRLRSYDHLACRLFNSMGVSSVEAMDLERLYVVMAKGSKAVASYSEFCLPEAEMRGKALERLSVVVMAAIRRLRDCHELRAILDEGALSLIDVEADRLLPPFCTLCVGSDLPHLRSDRALDRDREAAAAAIHAWLSLPVSALRSALALLSAGGLFFAAQCHDKGARAVLDRAYIRWDRFEAAALARMCGSFLPPLQIAGYGDRRCSLSPADLLPAQLLNPMGASLIEDWSLPGLYEIMRHGSRDVAFFSEFCSPGDEWRGLAISRLARVMVLAIKRIRTCPPLRRIIKSEYLGHIDREAVSLYPHFVVLDGPAGSAAVGDVSLDDVSRAARAVYDWLSRPQSRLRASLALLSAGGLFYAAQCQERGARAAITHAPIPACEFKEAAVAGSPAIPL